MNTRRKRFAITGAGGFLGFHTRAVLHSQGHRVKEIPLGDSFAEASAVERVNDVDRLIHIAGINRGTDEQIMAGNVGFAEQLAQVLMKCETPPQVVVFANSTQAGNGSVYGSAKDKAATVLEKVCQEIGVEFIGLKLPNLFGEHGRPFYNSVVATFCHQLARGERPEVKFDRDLDLLHAQNAAELLIGSQAPESTSLLIANRSVSEIRNHLSEIAATYRDGSIPPLVSSFDRDLFNTYRSFIPWQDRAISLSRQADARGAFFEVVRAQGSSSQTSFSTTVPGVTRGQHYHRRKIERFTVLSGSGQISMRKLFSQEVLTFNVDGREPVAIDMPTMWSHNITNIGADLLYTSFWSNELFDPASSDTFPEEV